MSEDKRRQEAEALLDRLLSAHSPSSDTPPIETEKALHMKLVALAEQQRNKEKTARSWFHFPVPLIASCATLFFVIVAGIIFLKYQSKSTGTHSPELIARSEVASGPVTITLRFSAPTRLDGVSLAVNLPKGVHFNTTNADLRSHSSHRWTTTFVPGENTIPFVVSVDRKGTHTITVQAEYNGYRHTQRIVLETVGDTIRISYYRPAKTPLNSNS